MKHLKKIFESKQSTIEELKDIFLPFEDQGFKVTIEEMTIFSNKRFFHQLSNEYIVPVSVSDLNVNEYDEFAYWYTGYRIFLNSPELNFDESDFFYKVINSNESFGNLMNLFSYSDVNLEGTTKSIDSDLNSLNQAINEITVAIDKLKRSKLLLNRVEKLITGFGFKKFDFTSEEEQDYDYVFNFVFALAKPQKANKIEKS